MDKFQSRKIAAIVIGAVALFQAIAIFMDMILPNLEPMNPLLPECLYKGLRNSGIAMATVYIGVVLLNVFYFTTKKLFWPVIVVSLLTVMAVAFFRISIDRYFLACN